MTQHDRTSYATKLTKTAFYCQNILRGRSNRGRERETERVRHAQRERELEKEREWEGRYSFKRALEFDSMVSAKTR